MKLYCFRMMRLAFVLASNLRFLLDLLVLTWLFMILSILDVLPQLLINLFLYNDVRCIALLTGMCEGLTGGIKSMFNLKFCASQ